MESATLLAPELEGLEKLNAHELTQRLKKYTDGGGGLVTPSDVEIARECVCRVRKAENLERLLGGPDGDGPKAACGGKQRLKRLDVLGSAAFTQGSPTRLGRAAPGSP